MLTVSLGFFNLVFASLVWTTGSLLRVGKLVFKDQRSKPVFEGPPQSSKSLYSILVGIYVQFSNSTQIDSISYYTT